ncbi:jg13979 [Pararge aegeria aegeria]|uniref:Jg13979 protein n=1 Tax=Pararge aegeria aegeria TaxID=348720 RepID=A0A8S4R9T5_9NEOP|nr:jg13979 [Pararge aegeria aegeria]
MLTMGLIGKLRVTQRATERAMLRDQIRTDIAQRVAKLKWQKPRTDKCSVGWPPTRWTDDIRQDAGSHWRQAAQDRVLWNLQKT